MNLTARTKTSSLALLVASCLLASSANAQVVLKNGTATVTFEPDGGKLTSFTLDANPVNPMHEISHFVAFDRWGPSTDADVALGIPLPLQKVTT